MCSFFNLCTDTHWMFKLLKKAAYIINVRLWFWQNFASFWNNWTKQYIWNPVLYFVGENCYVLFTNQQCNIWLSLSLKICLKVEGWGRACRLINYIPTLTCCLLAEAYRTPTSRHFWLHFKNIRPVIEIVLFFYKVWLLYPLILKAATKP